jgi:RND family efflux transporter MFP subunit
VIAGALVAFNFPGLSKSVKKLFAATEAEIINFPVKPAHLPVTVVERGLLESSENEDVFCQVEGSTTIISILPEGTRVKGADLLLVPAQSDVSGLPTEGKSLIVVANVDQSLHFRIFDTDSKMVLDTDEKTLKERARQVEELKGELESLWPPHELSPSEKSRVVTSVTLLFNHNQLNLGDLVCELDSSALQDNLKNQKIATLGAQAAFENAKLTREVAEISVVEYVEGIYKQEFETVQGEIALADAERKRAEDRIVWSDRMYEKGYVSKAQNIADKVSLQQKVFAFEQAQTKKAVLEKYTRDKTIKELQSEVEKAKSDELAKQQTWELEKDKEAKLEKQIKNCKLFAPGDGIVVYANDPSRFGSTSVQIEEGAAVRERQKIFSLPNIEKMRVNAKVHESMVDRIRPNLPARIRVDAFARKEDGSEEILEGVVESINPLPDTNSMFSSDIKVYTTRVTIKNGLKGLRPGMSAQVEILVTELDNVLCVPVQAILEYGGKDHVAVKTPSGYERQVVSLGISNDKLVEVTKGLKTGDLVALNPVSLMSEEEKRDLLGSSSKDTEKKDWGDAAKKAANSLVSKDALATKGGPDGKAAADGAGAAKGKGKGQGKGKGGFPKMDPAVREKLKNASPEEKRKILQDAGMAPEMIERMLNRGAGGGGGPRGGGGGGGGGGFGGPPGGGGS